MTLPPEDLRTTGPAAAALAQRVRELVDRAAELQIEWWVALWSGRPPAAELATAWSEAAHDVIDAQAKLLEHELREWRPGRLPEEPTPSVDDVLRHWTDVQRGMWVASLAAPDVGGPPAEAGARMISELEDAAERLIDEQAGWAAAFAAAPPAT
jgi:hypothetical protein